jgi:hypothetical protein
MERQPLRRTSIAAEVRVELARQNKTNASLAHAADMSVDTLRRRLKGDKPLYVEELVSFCDFFNIPIGEFVARAKANGAPDAEQVTP